MASYPVLDLHLAFSPITRPYLLDALRDALVHDGYFVLTNFDDYLDRNLLTDVNTLNEKFFNLPQLTKDRLNISKSRHFRGYYNDTRPKKSTTSSKLELDFPSLEPPSHSSSSLPQLQSPKKTVVNSFNEEIVFGMESISTAHLLAHDSASSEPTADHDIISLLRGPNQYPSSLTLPKFKSTVDKFTQAMHEFSYKFVSDLVTEVLSLQPTAFDYLFEETSRLTCHKLKFSKLVAQSNDPQTTTASYNTSSNNQLTPSNSPITTTYGSIDDGALFTFVNFPSTIPSATIIKPSGVKVELNDLPQGSLVVTSSEYLSVLTQGFCANSVLHVEAPSFASLAIPAYVTSFSQCISINFILKNFTFPKNLHALSASAQTERQDKIQQLTQQANGVLAHVKVPDEPTDDIFKNFGMNMFLNVARKHRSATLRWYPQLALRVLDIKTNAHTASFDSLEKSKLNDKLNRLYCIFVAVDASIVLHSISSLVPITLSKLKDSAARNSQYEVDLSVIQQINSVWPGAYYIGISHLDNKSHTIQFGTSTAGSDFAPGSQAPRSPQKRKHLFKEMCKEWLKKAFEVKDTTTGNAYLNIPLASIDAIPSSPSKSLKRNLDDFSENSPTVPLSTKKQRIMGLVRASPSPTKISLSGRTYSSSFTASRSTSFSSRIANTAPLTPRAHNKDFTAAPSPGTPSTLLERIRAKEQAVKDDLGLIFPPINSPRKGAPGTPVQWIRRLSPYEEYIKSKLPSVAYVVTGLRRPRVAVEVLSMDEAVKKIKDSVRITLSAEEVIDCINMLAKQLPKLIVLNNCGTLTSVRVYNGMTFDEAKKALANYQEDTEVESSLDTAANSTDEDTNTEEEEEEEVRSAIKSSIKKALESQKKEIKIEESPLMTPPQTPTRRHQAQMHASATPISGRVLRSASRRH